MRTSTCTELEAARSEARSRFVEYSTSVECLFAVILLPGERRRMRATIAGARGGSGRRPIAHRPRPRSPRSGCPPGPAACVRVPTEDQKHHCSNSPSKWRPRRELR
jgi:hypothetical protein